MQPSSLVFLVIIAVWAAYFVQYWVRRREHLATARSVDQFSESMRVLERRSPLPASDLSTPQPRSYAVTPARAARPQVLVKRAKTTTAGPAASAAPSVEDEQTVLSASSASARRTRAVILLGALATVVATIMLVALSMVPLAVLVVPVVAVGGAVTWARAKAQSERRARLASRRARPARPTRLDADRTARPAEQAHVPAPAETPSVHAEAEAEVDDVAAPAAPRRELYDVQAVEGGLHQPAAHVARPDVAEQVAQAPVLPARPLVDDDDIPLTWDPVPVPRPTYTMKARVTRPAPTSADLVGDADTEYAAYDETAERRVAGA